MHPVYIRLQELVPDIKEGDHDFIWIQKVIDGIEELEDKLSTSEMLLFEAEAGEDL